jgi:hypothetical protein
MTRRLACGCGNTLILASGYVAEVMTRDRIAELAAEVGWLWTRTQVWCPECRAIRMIERHEIPQKTSARKD